jgi:hypothetical protein
VNVSNDQSPPVRKVIPYKKGGRRQSPFASNAFQFSGTALDIAIQQREQEEQEETSTTSTDEGLPEELSRQVSPSPEVHTPQEITHAEETAVSPDTNSELPSVPTSLPQKRTETLVRRIAQRNTPAQTRIKNEAVKSTANSQELSTFIIRWKPFLTDTQIKICTYIYNNSTAVNKEFCFTSTSKLMAEVSKTERQIKTVLNQLIEWNFLIKGETIVNAPREKRGTHYKLNLEKS